MNQRPKILLPFVLLIALIIANIVTYVLLKRESSDVSSTTSSNSSDLVIGLVDSLTGTEATFGIESFNGLTMAFDEINQAGGVHGHHLKLMSLDDQGKPEEAANAAKRLVSTDHALAIIGTSSSQRTLVVAPIAQAANTPLIVPGATHPAITKVGDRIFRVCFMDDFQGEFMAQFALNEFHPKRVAIMTDVKSDYSVGLTEWFVKSLKKSSAKVVVRQSYTAGDLDFHSQLTSIRAAKPDVIFLPGFYTDVGLIVRQARELHIQAPILGGDGWDSPRLLEIAGKAIENTMFANHFVAGGDVNQKVRQFAETYSKRFGRAPGSSAALSYDSAQVLVDALMRLESIDHDALAVALQNVKNIDGVTGRISIGADRNAIKDAIVISVADHEFVKYKSIKK
jgi:branched-chain amino acid transport system substrate-binding protein